MRKKIILLLSLMISLVVTSSALAVTRGEALHEIMNALELPTWQGKSFPDVPKNHKYSNAIDSAFSMGILFPSDRFYPDLEATRLEALAFSFKAMGWNHEAKIAKDLFQMDRNLPPYLSPYQYLAANTEPSPPEEFIYNSVENLTRKDLEGLKLWLSKCSSRRVSWHATLKDTSKLITFHREGVGRPSRGWNIILGEFDDAKDAEKTLKKLKKKGIGAHIGRNDCSFELRVGPFKSHAVAWLKSIKLPSPYKGSPVISYGGGKGRSLFWVAVASDPSSFSIATSPSLGAYKLPLSEIVKRSKASGGINGGFFYGKKAIGTLIIDGMPVNATYRDRSAVGWNDRKAFFGDGRYGAYLDTDKGIVPLSAINVKTENQKVGLYTPDFGQFALSARGKGTEFTIKDEKIIKKVDSLRSNHFMKRGEIIVKANTSGLGPLEEATRGSISIDWKDSEMKGSKQVIQAGPMLFGMKRPFSCEHFSRSIIAKRHPRTLVGWDGKKMWWIVIDGRSAWHSVGATLSEAAFIAKQIGLKKALNLDGGGSSEFVWQGKILNRPSGGSERPLPYGVIF